MPQPDAYVRQHDFTDYSESYPAAPHNGQWLDEEFNAVKNTADEIIARLGLIQRDDGQIANLSIGLDQLKPEVVLGTPTDWATGQAYTLKAVVWESAILYVCNVAHTSGVFATDLGAGKWTAYLDYADPLGDAQDAVTAAEAAQEAAEDAQADAETAQTGAEAAQAAAEAAQAAAEAVIALISLPLAVDSGGTGGTTAAQARTNLELVIGTDVQAYHANLAQLAGLSLIADRLPYANGAGTLSLATLTSAGRAILDDADASAQRTTMGVVIGTDVQAYHANLAQVAGLSFIADRLPYANGTGTLSLATLTAAGRAILDDADAAAQRTTLGTLAKAGDTFTGASGVIAASGAHGAPAWGVFAAGGNNADFLTAIYRDTPYNAGNCVFGVNRTGETLVRTVLPTTDNAYTLGAIALRFTTVFATTGTINTSDAREKTALFSAPAALKRAIRRIFQRVGMFQWLFERDERGDAAPWHAGITAQIVEAEFAAEGIDPRDYALFFEGELPEGSAQPTRKSVRPDQLFYLAISLLMEGSE